MAIGDRTGQRITRSPLATQTPGSTGARFETAGADDARIPLPDAQTAEQAIEQAPAAGAAPTAGVQDVSQAIQTQPPAIVDTDGIRRRVDRASQQIGEVADREPRERAPATLESTLSQFQDIQTEQDQLFSNLQEQLAGAETADFSPDDQAQLDAIKNSFNVAARDQRLLNQQALGGQTRVQARSGRSRFAPELAQAEITSTMQAGVDKLNDINIRAQGALAEAKEAIRERNFRRILDSNNALQGALGERKSTIKDIQSSVQKVREKQREEQKAQIARLKAIVDESEGVSERTRQERESTTDAGLSFNEFVRDEQQKEIVRQRELGGTGGVLAPTPGSKRLAELEQAFVAQGGSLEEDIQIDINAPFTGTASENRKLQSAGLSDANDVVKNLFMRTFDAGDRSEFTRLVNLGKIDPRTMSPEEILAVVEEEEQGGGGGSAPEDDPFG